MTTSTTPPSTPSTPSTPSASCSEACATAKMQQDVRSQPASNCGFGEVPSALAGSTILITGAAGLVGSQLLHRLLSPPFSDVIKQVIAIIRGKSVEEATDRLPDTLRQYTLTEESSAKNQSCSQVKLVILNGDCSKPSLGLSDEQLKVAQRAAIVINAAADTRFMRPLADALSGVTDISYMTSRFSLTTPSVKTHIHLSTTFVGWVLKGGSTVYEDAHLSPPEATRDAQHETHANTYLQAKALGEQCVNSLFQPQLGQPYHGKVVRILRIAILGPALNFPRPGWGVHFNSSPISALIAMEKVPSRALHFFVPENAVLDVLPVDLAVNQIIALTAAAHRTHHLPSTNPIHPGHLANPANRHGVAIPCYHIASGMPVSQQVHVREIAGTELSTECKLDRPFIPGVRMLEVYYPFVEKVLTFDTARVNRVLGISSASWRGSAAPTGDNPHKPDTKGEVKGEAMSINEKDPGVALADRGGHTQPGNIPREWSDPAIGCGELEVNCAEAIAAVGGWAGYLRSARDEMEKRFASHDGNWEKYVD